MSTPDAYRELFERSADCSLMLKGDTLVDCNAAAVAMFQASDHSEMLKIHPSDLSPPLQPDGRNSYDKANEMIHIAFAQGSHRFEWDHQRLGGEVFEAEVLLTAIGAPSDQLLHSVVRDISVRKRLEAELRQAQKMEGVGKLAGGIAHDFNNLLVVMLGNCDLLERRELDHASATYVQQIREAGERAAGLIRQLLTFSRKQEVQEQDIDLAKVVEDLMFMLKRLVGEHIELEVSTSGPATIFANLHRAEQLVLNLVSNAQDAMPDGGHLTVEVGTGRSDLLGNCAVLRVADTGDGMSEGTRVRALEPFFTTKPMGAGTGLGLATVHNIVQQSGGEIAIESGLGVGTTVTVRFPLVDRVVVAKKRVDLPIEQSGTETILLVEDDPAIRQMTDMLLSTAGFRVLTAANGAEGLIMAASHRAAIRLIMTDVVMPRLGGPEMVLKLRAGGHRTPVLFMSGYTDATLHKLDSLHEELDLIEKPFNLRTLVSRVRAAIDRADEATDG